MKKNEGKQFEQSFQDCCVKSNFYYLRLHDTATWTQGKEANFTPQNPYDMLIYTSPFLWTLELKSTHGSSISFYPNTPNVKPKDTKTQVMIKAHQVKELMKCNEYQGVLAGFILNFRPRELKSGTTKNKAYFLHITDFMHIAQSKVGKASINIEDCQQYGVEIFGEIKKVHYKYDIPKFINDATKFFILKKYITKEFLETIKKRVERLLTFGEDIT